ncbi:MAG: glycosyltransferase family A protein [Patescibacteria group bacterium]
MISIIIPIYNQVNKIFKCLNSILAQTYKDYEIIIVNDGSGDNINKAIQQYKNIPSIIYYELFVNQGASAARNYGFKQSKGEYLFFCDADAILQPKTLEIMERTLRNHPEASYAYPSFLWGRKLFKVGKFDEEKLKIMPYIHTMALIRRNHFPKNGWDQSIKKFQDWDLWLTMLKQGHVGCWIDQILFKVQLGGVISTWLPSCAYKLLPFLPTVKKYKAALEIIKKKHKL